MIFEPLTKAHDQLIYSLDRVVVSVCLDNPPKVSIALTVARPNSGTLHEKRDEVEINLLVAIPLGTEVQAVDDLFV